MAWYKRQDSDEDLTEAKRSVPAGVFSKCPGCRAQLLTSDLEQNLNVCPQCEHHFPFPTQQRLDQLLDPGTFVEADASIESVDPLGFKDSKRYQDRLRAARKTAGGSDAIKVGAGFLEGQPVELGIFVFEFMGGSMGSVVGEKITRVFERALERRVPAIVFSASGGARMQEGMLSLMQMAKTSAALARLREAGMPVHLGAAAPDHRRRRRLLRHAGRRDPRRAQGADRLRRARASSRTPSGRGCRPASSAPSSCSSTACST